ncbi:MAG: ATP-dependent Clp protease adapter ClpS [Alistipes senegalensis]|nr:ATP-dependent Clp protease adapter ClpS [Oxalobacter formigenes]MCM1280624.1 ATP-dependent Clp protease adapter ClpS [Alistipes senegalensis]
MGTQQENGILLEQETLQADPPPLYRVVLLNDDFTPMEFVITVLQNYFHKDRTTATQIMLQVHHSGRGTCGIFPKDIASTKVDLVLGYARSHGHPLQCVMEEA